MPNNEQKNNRKLLTVLWITTSACEDVKKKLASSQNLLHCVLLESTNTTRKNKNPWSVWTCIKNKEANQRQREIKYLWQ